MKHGDYVKIKDIGEMAKVIKIYRLDLVVELDGKRFLIDKKLISEVEMEEE